MNERVRPGPGGWSEFEVATGIDESRTVRGQVIGPLGVHREGYGWRVSHLPTGCGVSDFAWKKDAASYASDLRKRVEGESDTDDVLEATQALKRAGAVSLRERYAGCRPSGPLHPSAKPTP